MEISLIGNVDLASIQGLLGWFNLWDIEIPAPVALAAIALLGYMFGQRTRKVGFDHIDQARREMKRAKLVARELEKIAETVRRDLATHRTSVAKFKERVTRLSGSQTEASWRELCQEAEEMLKPTLKLAMQISLAYDEIRQQTNQLMSFTEVRTDPLTGVSNRRALDETLETMIALLHRYDTPFSVAILDIDHFKQINDEHGHLHGDRVLQNFARLLDESVRDTDVVARYGGEEFVVVMPQTSLTGSVIFAERLREMVEEKLPITISGGLAEAADGDTSQSLLSRADSALYSAKAGGRNRIYRHDGQEIDAASDASRHAPAVVAASYIAAPASNESSVPESIVAPETDHQPAEVATH